MSCSVLNGAAGVAARYAVEILLEFVGDHRRVADLRVVGNRDVDDGRAEGLQARLSPPG